MEDYKNKAKESLSKTIAQQREAGALVEYLKQSAIKERFDKLVAGRGEHIVSSVLQLTKSNPKLLTCDPITVVGAVVQAVLMGLPIEQTLGYVYIVPYEAKTGAKAQLQVGYKGFIQLALRTGLYRTINTSTVRESQRIKIDPLSGYISFDGEVDPNSPVSGYVAYLEFISGFKKGLYMSVEEAQAHGAAYSRTYRHEDGMWAKRFDFMAQKTVLKLLLSRYGVLNTELQRAIQYDQAVVKGDSYEDYEYVDAPKGSLQEEEKHNDNPE